MIVSITDNGYVSVCETDCEKDIFFKRLYIGYSLSECKMRFKKEFKEFKKGSK